MADEMTRELVLPSIPQNLDPALELYMQQLNEVLKELASSKAYLSGVALQEFSTDGAGFKDEDDMASDSAIAVNSMQGTKAYIDNICLNTILSDGTAGRVLRFSLLKIDDGTNANTLKCTLSSIWNGDAIAETDNVAKGATTGDFTFNAGGDELTLEIPSAESHNVLVAVGNIRRNAGGTAATADIQVVSNDIYVSMRNAASGGQLDMTVLVDTGLMYINLISITDS